MKKFFLAALLATSAAAALNSPLFANGRTFGIFICRRCRCCCDGFSLCVRPYNAFTPVACGTLYYDGLQPATPCQQYSRNVLTLPPITGVPTCFPGGYPNDGTPIPVTNGAFPPTVFPTAFTAPLPGPIGLPGDPGSH